MATASERLFSSSVRHAVGVQRFIGGRAAAIAREWRRIVNALGSVLVSRGTSPLPGELTGVLREAGEMGLAEYRALGVGTEGELETFAGSEAGFQRRSILALVPQAVEVRAAPPEAIAKAARVPIEGATVPAWFAVLAVQQGARLSAAVGAALAKGDDLADVLRRLPRDLRLGLHHLQSLILTAFAAAAAAAAEASGVANQSMFQGVLWSGVLDTRITRHICLPRDGKLYSMGSYEPIGHALPWGPGPGRIHYRCRSISVPVFHNGDVLGLEGQTRRTKEAFDGTVPIRTSAEDWLRGRPRADVEEVFGKNRAELWINGGLSAEDMLRADGKSFQTLDELAAFDAGDVG